MTKKVCISGYYGFDNFGDETILKILIENLKKNSSEIQITVFSSNPEKTKALYEVQSVKSFDILNVIKQICSCDCLISGGGSLLQDVTSLKSLIYYITLIFIAQFFRKKTIIFAQGIGPINNNFFRKITFNLLKRATDITVRDEKSYKLLSENNINAIKCSDPVWNLSVENNSNPQKVGVQLRSFSLLSEEFIKNLAICVNKHYFDKEICVLSLQNQLDLEVCNKFKEEILKINPQINVKVIENNSNEEVIKNITELSSFVAMRYHACLVAIKSGIKLLPINYDIKVETLANDFNLKEINLAKNDNLDEIFNNFVQTSINYDENKIKSMMYDFTRLKDKI
jgi:polysaccharide pyruvyl transferase CsaB